MAKIDPKEWRGVISLLLTPFNDDLTVDYDAYAKYVEWQAASGTHRLFPVCGSSEMMSLTLDERIKIAQTAVKHSNGVPCMASANLEPSWYGQVEEVKRMEQTGVAGLVFVTHCCGDNDERMVQYITDLTNLTTLPVFLYEFPGLKPHLMSGKAYGELAKNEKIVGIKDTTCNMPAIKEKIAVQGDTAVMQANIPFLFEAYKAGARGVVATPTSCGAALFRKMYDEFFVEKNIDKAEKTFQQVILLDQAIDSGFNCSAKYLCALQGVPIKWNNRGGQELSPARMNSIKTFYDYARAEGFMK